MSTPNDVHVVLKLSQMQFTNKNVYLQKQKYIISLKSALWNSAPQKLDGFFLYSVSIASNGWIILQPVHQEN